MKLVVALIAALSLGLVAFAGTQEVQIKVDGMKCKTSCPAKLSAAVNGVKGADAGYVCVKSGTATVKLSDEATPSQVMAAINKTGLKAVGQKVSFEVEGMHCVSCEGKLQKAFAKMDGVTAEKTCSKSGHVAVVLSGKDSAAKVKETIVAAGYKVK